MAPKKNDANLTTGERHALRLGIKPQTTASRPARERLAEQAAAGDPTRADTLRILADTAAARRAENYARFVEQEAARNQANPGPQRVESSAGTVRGRIAAEWVTEQIAARAKEEADATAARRAREADAVVKFRETEAAALQAQQAARVASVRKPAPWELAQIREQMARATGDGAA
jgi:hypothetical protein